MCFSAAASSENDHGSTRPLFYVSFLSSADGAAARAGLQPGDVLWQVGSGYLPRDAAAVWLQHNNDEAACKALETSWQAALAPSGGGAVHVVVLRGNHQVELDLPATPAAKLGADIKLRRVPAFEYDALIARHGSSPSSEPAAATNTAAGAP